jgi:hypothetical protein
MRHLYQNLFSCIGVYGTLLALLTFVGCGGGGCPIGTVRVPDPRQPEGYRCDVDVTPRGHADE